MIRALTTETHENCFEAIRYLNMDLSECTQKGLVPSDARCRNASKRADP